MMSVFNKICLKLVAELNEVKIHHGDNRPLDDELRRVIDDNRHGLVKVIDPKPGFINRLYANGCFNEEHKEHIECGEKVSDKVDRLLDIVRRRSVADFNKLVEALYSDDQPVVAKVLAEREGKTTRSTLPFV